MRAGEPARAGATGYKVTGRSKEVYNRKRQGVRTENCNQYKVTCYFAFG